VVSEVESDVVAASSMRFVIIEPLDIQKIDAEGVDVMAKIVTYQDLVVWQKSMDLAKDIYRFAWSLPPEEKYALSDQMRRAAVSIPSNIAEGQARKTTRDFVHFLYIARGVQCRTDDPSAVMPEFWLYR
jgi:hypothetical protein